MIQQNVSRTLAAAVVSALILAGSGCAVGPEFKRPAAPNADKYVQHSAQAEVVTSDIATQQIVLGQAADPEWWRAFKSESLNQVVQRALEGNKTLVAASWTLAQAEEQATARTGARFSKVDMTGGVGRQKYGAQFLGPLPKPPPFTYFAIGPAISYRLDYTGGVARSIEQQVALAEYRKHQLEAAGIAVAGNTVLQALNIASLNAQIATVQALLDRDRENLKLVQVAFDEGSVSRLDLVSAQSQLASDTTALPPLRQELSVARHALAVIVGSSPADAMLPEFDLAQLQLPQQIPVSVPSELAARRPDILAAEAQLHAATAAVGVATANLYPRIDLTASAGLSSTTTGALFDKASSVWSLVSGVTAPVFDGGTLRAEKRAAIDAMHVSVANYEQTVLESFRQVADSLEALNHDAEGLRAQTQAEQAARDAVELTRESYQEGNVGVLQVLDAERRYQQARLGFVKAQAQRYVDTAQLFLALGGAKPE